MRTEILRMREDMWATTASRLKTQLKVYPGADEFMTCGVEDYTFKDGRKTRVRFGFLCALYSLLDQT
jgi:hypothetical protein